MTKRAQYEELNRQLGAVGSVTRWLMRDLPVGLPRSSAAVLELLDRHGEMRMSRLSELLAVDTSVTSRHVALGVARGWIERSLDPADRRSRILRLTPAGRDRLDEVSGRVAQVLAERLRDWSDDEVNRLARLMARLRASFDDPWADGVPDTAPPEHPGST